MLMVPLHLLWPVALPVVAVAVAALLVVALAVAVAAAGFAAAGFAGVVGRLELVGGRRLVVGW